MADPVQDTVSHTQKAGGPHAILGIRALDTWEHTYISSCSTLQHNASTKRHQQYLEGLSEGKMCGTGCLHKTTTTTNSSSSLVLTNHTTQGETLLSEMAGRFFLHYPKREGSTLRDI